MLVLILYDNVQSFAIQSSIEEIQHPIYILNDDDVTRFRIIIYYYNEKNKWERNSKQQRISTSVVITCIKIY